MDSRQQATKKELDLNEIFPSEFDYIVHIAQTVGQTGESSHRPVDRSGFVDQNYTSK